MTLTLHGGPHANCHFRWERDKPPEEIRLRGPKPGTTAVYRLTDWKCDEQYTDTWVYGKCQVTWSTPPRLVNFIASN